MPVFEAFCEFAYTGLYTTPVLEGQYSEDNLLNEVWGNKFDGVWVMDENGGNDTWTDLWNNFKNMNIQGTLPTTLLY